MATSLSSIKFSNQMNENTKMTVFGYLRKLQSNISLSNLPMMICYLCLAYRSHDEYFDNKMNKNGGIEYSSNLLTITNILDRCIECGEDEFENCYECRKTGLFSPIAYGHQTISSHKNIVAKWKLRINSYTKLKRISHRELQVIICMCDENNNDMNDVEWKTMLNVPICQEGGWTSYTTGEIVDDSYGYGRTLIPYEYNIKSCDRLDGTNICDIVTITLDTKQKLLFGQINDGSVKTLIKNVPIGSNLKYKLSVAIWDKGDSVSFIDFVQKMPEMDPEIYKMVPEKFRKYKWLYMDCELLTFDGRQKIIDFLSGQYTRSDVEKEDVLLNMVESINGNEKVIKETVLRMCFKIKKWKKVCISRKSLIVKKK